MADSLSVITAALRESVGAFAHEEAVVVLDALKQAGFMLVPTELVAAKPKVPRAELRAGMICRMKKGGIRRIDDPSCGGNGNWVKWTRIDEGQWQGRGGKTWAFSFADAVAEVLSHG